MTGRAFCFTILTTLFSLKAATQLNLEREPLKNSQARSINIVPQNFYNQHKGYMCRKEDLLQKATGINLFFRLGSKNYVDYLERKPNATKPVNH